MVCLRCLVHVTSADAAFNSRWCLFFNCLDYYINNNINTNGVLRWNSVDCPWILWVFYWFKILISITAIEFAINTHSMEFLGHTPWNSVDSCGQELRIPWTDSMELPPKVGTVTESIRNPYGMSTDEKMEFGWACHPKCIPQKFQNLSTDIPWNPAESMESTEFRRKRWGTVKYSSVLQLLYTQTQIQCMAF